MTTEPPDSAIQRQPPHNETIEDPRVYFAAERTLLAWVRTGLSMMGFGFVLARFGLFLRELAMMHESPPSRQVHLSLTFGVTLVVLGVLVNVSAAIRHWRTTRSLFRREPIRFNRISMGVVIATLLAAMGVLMSIYLVFGLDEAG